MSNLVPGVLLHHFGIAVLLALPVSLVVLAWYRRAVLRRMRERGSAGPDAPRLAPMAAAAAAQAEGKGAPPESRLRVRLVVVYTLAAIAASAVSTGLYLGSFDLPFGALRAFTMGYALAWPLVPTLAVLLTLSLRQAVLLVLGYYLVGAAVVVLWSTVSAVLGRPGVSPLGNLGGYTGFLAVEALPPLAVIAVTSGRKLRPVTPLVLAGLLVFSFAALGVQAGFLSLLDSVALRKMLLVFPRSDVVWFMLAALPVAYVCWLALRALARGYEAKAFSDTQLVVDSWWLIAAFSTSVTLATTRQWWGLLGLVAFVAYRAVVTVGLALWPIDGRTGARRLLLLRVFGFRRRTERLFDAVGERWRLSGSVQMIGGTDVAGRTLDPGDIVGFVGGRLRDQFVSDRAQLERRLADLDDARDPDGRFRVNEFLCHDDTWQGTLESLLLRSEVVLMDLRGFSQANSGCLYELGKLAEHRRLERTLFVVDGTTDVELLRATLAQAAAAGGAQGAPALHTVHTSGPSSLELGRILGSLSALSAA
jgi:hypothetical protein